MNILEKFRIYCAHQQNKQMNKVLFDLQNPIFDITYNHYTKEQHTQIHITPTDSSKIHITT